VGRALSVDHRTAPVDAADRAMLDYAVKLTRTPAAVGAGDVEALRDVGFSDAAVLDICQVTSYYNYVNRLADGLGVELEEHWNVNDLTITPEEFRERTGHRPPGAGA
jgi:uncharacterized peroxidase-related enzyme